eukprot:s278_g52.t1
MGHDDMLDQATVLRARLRQGRRREPAEQLLAPHRILLFSLVRQRARRHQFFEQLERFPALLSRVEWVRAVDGSTLDLQEVPREIVDSEGIKDALAGHPRVLGYVLTRGAIGLAWTWFTALDTILNDEDPQHIYLICEDDARFSPEFPEDFRDLCLAADAHDPDWEVLHVGYHVASTTVRGCGRPGCDMNPASCPLGRPTQLFGAYGVALRPRGARKLREKLFPVNLQVDTELSRLYQSLAKGSGNLQARVQQQRLDSGDRLRVYAPRCASEAQASQFPRWKGPLVLAPPSRAESTDIQVLSSANWTMQYAQNSAREGFFWRTCYHPGIWKPWSTKLVVSAEFHHISTATWCSKKPFHSSRSSIRYPEGASWEVPVMPVNSLNLETCSTTVQGSTFEVPKRYRIDEPMSHGAYGIVVSAEDHLPTCSIRSSRGDSEGKMSDDFAVVRSIIEDKLHQEFYNVPTKDLPPRMQPRQLPNLQDAMKIDWDDWKSWEWMQPGWKGVKMHSQCVINGDGSAEIRSVWK